MMTSLHYHLLESASLAPSAHNTQPWRLEFREDGVEIWANPQRRLAVADASNADLLHALGALLENCVLTLGQHGQLPAYHCATNFDASRPIVQLQWRAVATVPRADVLYRQIPLRRTSRRAYEQRSIPQEVLNDLHAVVKPPFVLRVESSIPAVNELRRMATKADLALMRDGRVAEELFGWVRFTRGDANWFRDGLNAACMNWSSLEARAARILLTPAVLSRLHALGLTRFLLGNVDAQAPRCPAIALLSFGGACDDSVALRIEAGRQLQRLWLTASAHGLCTHPLSAAVDHPESRAGVFAHFAVRERERHVNLFRLGYSEAAPRSYRLPADEIVIPA